MTDQSGAVTFAQTYDPYGVITANNGASYTAYGFTGEAQDSVTNLVYLRARFYNPRRNNSSRKVSQMMHSCAKSAGQRTFVIKSKYNAFGVAADD